MGIATVGNPTLVLCLSLAGGLGELTLRLTMPMRDRFLYQCMFGRSLRRDMSADEQLRNPRNKLLRANNSAYETMSEIVSIWNGVAMVLCFDMSKDGESSPSVQLTLLAGVIQTIVELLTDYFSVVMIAVLQNIDVLAQLRGRYWYWSCPAVPFMMKASSALFLAFSGFYCRSPHLHGSTWMVCPS